MGFMNNIVNKMMKKTVISMGCILFSSLILSACQTTSVNGHTPNSQTFSPKSIQNNSNIQNLNAQSLSNLSLNTQTMMGHLSAFQTIAQQNGGNRAVGTKGGQASATYIQSQLKQLGFTAQAIPFENRNKIVGQNIILEISGGNKDKAIIVGAHYDSVKMGPGINDNATGVALLLALAEQISKQKVKFGQTVYLAFWDSEEDGIGGSQAFVKQLSEKQLQGIKAYINVDMVGTKDPNILIADADKSSVDEMEAMLKERGMSEEDYKPLTDGLRTVPSHAGDLALENELKVFFRTKNIKFKEDVSTLTVSDTLPFLGKVPVTSIILFNEQMKGNVLEFAPCYHQACDTVDLVDPQSLALSSEAIVHLLKILNVK